MERVTNGKCVRVGALGELPRLSMVVQIILILIVRKFLCFVFVLVGVGLSSWLVGYWVNAGRCGLGVERM